MLPNYIPPQAPPQSPLPNLFFIETIRALWGAIGATSTPNGALLCGAIIRGWIIIYGGYSGIIDISMSLRADNPVAEDYKVTVISNSDKRNVEPRDGTFAGVRSVYVVRPWSGSPPRPIRRGDSSPRRAAMFVLESAYRPERGALPPSQYTHSIGLTCSLGGGHSTIPYREIGALRPVISQGLPYRTAHATSHLNLSDGIALDLGDATI
ncbi:hypothetical protein J6590_069133 [Homalodisca vitripennis]|nr:hypothetical protein J6590_069133 [Homalodisca vitripennis]